LAHAESYQLRPRSHARPRAGLWRVRLLFVDAPSRVDRTRAPDSVLALRHAALGARRRLTRAGILLAAVLHAARDTFLGMVEKDLLDILVCPDDLTPVRLATDAELTALNARIAAGQVKNRGGQPVATAVKEGLVRADGKYLYVVDDDIPVMLIDEALPLA